MIRFQPDTWRDALWRPISMAAPDAGVYVEVIAPDLRFAFLLVLFLSGFLIFRRHWKLEKYVGQLLILLGLQFVIWLYSSGNGRYFISGLMLVGLTSISVIHKWPVTRTLRLTIALGLCVLQGYVVYLAEPFSGMSFAPWREAPAFPLEVPPYFKSTPATYISLSTNSYSIMAPRFNPDSRWINLADRQDGLDQDAEGLLIKQILSNSKDIFAVLIGTREMLADNKQIATEFITSMRDRLLSVHLQFNKDACSYLSFPSPDQMNVLDKGASGNEGVIIPGFWVCKLTFLKEIPGLTVAAFPPMVDKVMSVMDRNCHRFFAQATGRKIRIPDAAMIYYADADMRLYITNAGRVSYKYFRGISPISLGQVTDVLAPDFKFECDNIRGRSGLPWERQY